MSRRCASTPLELVGVHLLRRSFDRLNGHLLLIQQTLVGQDG